MIRAYAETYLEDAMDNLGAMYDYAVDDLGMTLEDVQFRFIQCGLARDFGNGQPYAVAGHSGVELAAMIVYRTTGSYPETYWKVRHIESEEYWTGWILAYFQWYTGYSFKYIEEHGLPIADVRKMYYPLHEADVGKFVRVALDKMERYRKASASPVKAMRRNCGLSQEELAQRSGTSLRMIRAYEQKQRDLSKAEAGTVLNLAHVLNCSAEDLM